MEIFSYLQKVFGCSVKIQTHAMPQYYRDCSIAISQAAGEKRSYKSSETQKSWLHGISSPRLKQEGSVEARDLVPKLLLVI